MAEKKKNPAINISFYESLLLVLYLCIGFIPNLGAVDKIAPQWLAMGGLNFISGLYIVRNYSSLADSISIHFSSWITLLYAFFIVWAGVSFFYAINATEVVVNFSRQFSVFFMYCNMAILLSTIKNKAKFLSFILAGILLLEVYAIFQEAIEMIKTTGMISSGSLKGVTANRNIAAFSIAIKIPFVLYLLVQAQSNKIKVLGVILITLSTVSLSMIQSRASYIAVGLIIALFLWVPFYFKKEQHIGQKIKMLAYVLIPLIVTISFNQLYLASKGADAVARASTISISTNDGSVNQRLRYYEDVVTHIASHPIFGVGLGNWKFKSIDYDKEDIVGYVVPYHAHSDFIQLGAELGILGFLSYLGIFILAVLFVIKYMFGKVWGKEQKLFIFFLLVSLGVYFIDANLNFPIARPQVLVVWALIMALITSHVQQRINTKTLAVNSGNKGIIYLLLIIALPALFVSNKVYGSLKNQMYLLRDFNNQQYNTPISQIEAMDFTIPNVTVTTLPLKALKARYYINAKQYDKALQTLSQSEAPNPYLFYTENLKSVAFEAKGQIDSAFYYAQKAYKGLPNNSLHVANFVKLAMQKKERIAIEQAADQLKDTQQSLNWQNILTAYIDIVGVGNEKLMQLTEHAVQIFPHDSNFLLLRKLANVTPENIQSGKEIAGRALELFNNKDYEKAAQTYIEAAAVDPMEFSYFENAATSFYILKDYGNAMLYSSKVIEQFNPGTGKAEYLHGISKISTGDTNGGCEYIAKAMGFGYNQAENIQKLYCN